MNEIKWKEKNKGFHQNNNNFSTPTKTFLIFHQLFFPCSWSGFLTFPCVLLTMPKERKQRNIYVEVLFVAIILPSLKEWRLSWFILFFWKNLRVENVMENKMNDEKIPSYNYRTKSRTFFHSFTIFTHPFFFGKIKKKYQKEKKKSFSFLKENENIKVINP